MFGNDLRNAIRIDSTNSVHTHITIYTNTKRNGFANDRPSGLSGQLIIDTELVVEFIWALRPISISYPDVDPRTIPGFPEPWYIAPTEEPDE